DRDMKPWVPYRSLALVSFAGLGLLACSSASSPSGSSGAKLDGYDDPSMPSCDPLAGVPVPITLGTLVGAGRDTDGTIYAIDQAPDLRGFVSSGAMVQRVVVAGSGSDGASSVNVSVSQPVAFSLKVELTGGVATRMGIVHGALDAKTFEIGVVGTALELVPRA